MPAVIAGSAVRVSWKERSAVSTPRPGAPSTASAGTGQSRNSSPPSWTPRMPALWKRGRWTGAPAGRSAFSTNSCEWLRLPGAADVRAKSTMASARRALAITSLRPLSRNRPSSPGSA